MRKDGMITSSDNFLARKMDDAFVFTLSRPDLIDPDCIRRIGDEISACTKDEPQPRVVVDFENVQFLSSAALGMLVALHKALTHHGGRLCISNVQQGVEGVFRVTRLRAIIPIHETTEDAIRSLR